MSGAMVPRYRKKPVVIEAMHWDGQPATATMIIDWILAGNGTARYHDEDDTLHVDTMEGTIPYAPGWVIIKGVQDEFYGCQEDIFEQTYEPMP